MKPEPGDRDAYGREIWSFLKREGEPFEIGERDDGYITAARSVEGYFAECRAWPGRQRIAVRYSRRGDSALDVGCGAGRVALYLQERGLRVTAIDNSPLAVKAARTRGVEDARMLPFESIARLRNGAYSTVIMFGNNFGLSGSYSRARRLLRDLHRITTARAVLLAESLDPYKTEDSAHLKYQRANIGKAGWRVRFESACGTESASDPGSTTCWCLPRRWQMSWMVLGWAVERLVSDGGSPYVGVIVKV
jgi:SAM-dependent methyltransferase